METQCFLFLLGLMNKKRVMELSGKEVWPSFTSLGELVKTYLFRSFLVSLSSEIRIPAFSGDWEGLLTIVRTAQGKVRAVLSRLCDVLLNRSG